MIAASANIYFIICSLLVLAGSIASILIKRKAQLVVADKDEIRIVNRKAVSSKSELIIIELDAERFLLSHSGDRIGLLSRLEQQVDLTSRNVPFDSLLDESLDALEKGNS